MDITNHIRVFEAKEYRFHNIECAVYFWYFPIRMKYKEKYPEQAIKDFFDDDFEDFNSMLSQSYTDSQKGVQIDFKPLNFSSNYELIFKDDTDSKKYGKHFFELFNLVSFLNKPIYIGKANRNHYKSLSERLDEHIKGKTKFSSKLKRDLMNLDSSNLSVENMIIMSLDLKSLLGDEIYNDIDESVDVAFFFEKIFIRLLKPIYNERN